MIPFICVGQTTIDSTGSVINPSTNVNGLVGESTLPYVVPANKILHITRLSVEPLWGAALILFVADDSIIQTSNCLCTYSSGGKLAPNTSTDALIDSKVWDTDYYIPAGKKLNLRLSGTLANWTYGWCVGGELLDA